MSVEAKFFDPDKDQSQGQSQNGAPGAPVNVTGGSAQSSPQGALPKSQNEATPEATSSGRFTNLTNYLNANKNYNAPQGGLAGQVVGGLQQQGNQIQQNLGTAQNQFNQDANAGRTQYNEDLINQAITNPYAVANNTDQLNQFTKQRDAAYTGPQGIDQSNQLRNQTQNYQQQTSGAQNENGRFSVLRNMFNTPQYNQGQQKLDNVFLQTAPQQLKGVAALGNKATSNVNQAVGQAGADAQNYKNEAQNTKNQTRGRLNSAITGFGDETDPNSYVAKQMAAAKLTRDTAYDAAVKNAAKGQFTQADVTRMGVPLDSPIYQLDPSKYLHKADDNGISRNNILTNDDYNRIDALRSLAGNTAQGDVAKYLDEYKGNAPAVDADGKPVLDAQGNPTYTLANTWAGLKDPYTFDNENFQNDLIYAKQDVDRAPQEIREALDAINGELYAHGGLHTALQTYEDNLANGGPYNDDGQIESQLTNGNAQNEARAMGYGNWVNKQLNFERQKLANAQAKQAALQRISLVPSS